MVSAFNAKNATFQIIHQRQGMSGRQGERRNHRRSAVATARLCVSAQSALPLGDGASKSVKAKLSEVASSGKVEVEAVEVADEMHRLAVRVEKLRERSLRDAWNHLAAAEAPAAPMLRWKGSEWRCRSDRA